MRREVMTAAGWGVLTTLILADLIVVGSRNLAHFDAALVAYTFTILFAAFGLTYRYALWLQRPPMAGYFESLPGHLDRYRAIVFGFPTFSFPIKESIFGFMLLNLSPLPPGHICPGPGAVVAGPARWHRARQRWPFATLRTRLRQSAPLPGAVGRGR
ncbi:MAG: hypothetical protein HYR94_00205 [Chloroflexi bacterium]|nr:hypothetical protein [Chloroflexota bacterium]